MTRVMAAPGVPGVPGAGLTVIEAEFVLGRHEAGLDRSSQPGDAGKFREANIGRGEYDIVASPAKTWIIND
jgi:hypothetical protein